jgi:hypothetical protein
MGAFFLQKLYSQVPQRLKPVNPVMFTAALMRCATQIEYADWELATAL